VSRLKRRPSAERRWGERQLLGVQFRAASVSPGSGVPVGRLELPTYRPQPTPAGAEKSWAAALKNKQLLAAVCLQQLYFETGHWQRDFLIDRMTADGRNRPDALMLRSVLSVGQLPGWPPAPAWMGHLVKLGPNAVSAPVPHLCQSRPDCAGFVPERAWKAMRQASQVVDL
jgi:hypothetical protein